MSQWIHEGAGRCSLTSAGFKRHANGPYVAGPGLGQGKDLDGAGALELADLEAFARAYGKPTGGIRANLARMLAAFDLPPDRLPRAVFLTLVTQYWFDPSPEVPGRWLFAFEEPAGDGVQDG